MTDHNMRGRGDCHLVLQNSDTPFEAGSLFPALLGDDGKCLSLSAALLHE